MRCCRCSGLTRDGRVTSEQRVPHRAICPPSVIEFNRGKARRTNGGHTCSLSSRYSQKQRRVRSSLEMVTSEWRSGGSRGRTRSTPYLSGTASSWPIAWNCFALFLRFRKSNIMSDRYYLFIPLELIKVINIYPHLKVDVILEHKILRYLSWENLPCGG